MNRDKSFHSSLLLAIVFHGLIGFFLMGQSTHKPAVIEDAKKNEPGAVLPLAEKKEEPDLIKAVSLDANEVQKTVHRIKEEQKALARAEAQRQQALKNEAIRAKNERIAEQQRIEKLKQEARELALAHKKQVEEEKNRLKKLAEEKALEAKRLEDLKKKQQELAKKQAIEAQKLKAQEEARLKKVALEEAERKQKRALEQSAIEAANQAKMAGEVNKYKALILNAISARWIIPENTNKTLSSQFRLRLAPDGAVLEVTLIRSSGDAILDRSAQTAIYKASPLPVPNDVATFNLFREISLTVRPMNVRG